MATDSFPLPNRVLEPGVNVTIAQGGPSTGKTTLAVAIADTKASEGKKVLLCAPTQDGLEELVHEFEERAGCDPDVWVLFDGEQIADSDDIRTFSYELRQRIAQWADDPDNEASQFAKDYLNAMQQGDQDPARTPRLKVLHSILATKLLSCLTYVLCAMPSPAIDPLLVKAFKFDILIIDNAHTGQLDDFAKIARAHKGKFDEVLLLGTSEATEGGTAPNAGFVAMSDHFLQMSEGDERYKVWDLKTVYAK
ncbi:hypothetical protein BDV96DRAFT_648493 [Lophiotrema nucula]|uniref:P-loop containing nucleoside triphosphate hydrolase protein n=1 Tax=Lophiotrema nucula TaxID=690887 RepID=A0A6A5Z1B0_9PLEO|nr:hypothetical protein BDV96DRAFT_648493 [Lophiotrema nucula]